MKKFINMITVVFLVYFVGILSINAASFGNISGGNSNGKTFKVTVNDANGFVFSYDKNMISCGGNNTSAKDEPYGRLINSNKVELSCSINTDKNATLELKLIDLGGKIAPITLNYTINPVNTTTTKPVEQPTTTTAQATTTTAQAKSTDASLSSLSVKDSDGNDIILSPSFANNIYEYEGILSGTAKTVNIVAKPTSDKANVVISSNASNELIEGENNKITITVTAEDNITKKTYTLNIKKQALSSNANLASLTIEELPDFKFDSSTFKYNIKIDDDLKTLMINYKTEDEKSSVAISGNKDLKNKSKIKILVTAEDGTKKEYILTIQKTDDDNKKALEVQEPVSEEKNPLIIMVLSIIAFGLIGSIVYVAKK